MVEVERDLREYYQDQLKIIQTPKTFDKVPETYKISHRQYDKIVPDSERRVFNENIFYNLIHRECFRSCQDIKSSVLSSKEVDCFSNCQSKHLASVGIFERLTLFNRRIRGTTDFLDMNEYETSPQDMGRYYPTDDILKHQLAKHRYERSLATEHEKKVQDIVYKNNKNNTLLDLLEGVNKQSSQYQEYLQLKTKYADKLNERFEGKASWDNIDGDNFSPE